VVTRTQRRAAVTAARTAAGLSERRACRFTGFARSSQRYQRRRPTHPITLGFFRTDRNGQRIIAHAGDMEAFHCDRQLLLDQDGVLSTGTALLVLAAMLETAGSPSVFVCSAGG